jgi:hypothetical protein
VEFLQDSDPTWQAWMPLAIQNVQGLQANWLVLEPSWTFDRADPLVFNPIPGQDPLWVDVQDTISHAKSVHLNVALFPTVNLSKGSADWWAAAPRTADWWNAWFARYTAYAVYFADLASEADAQSLILGGDWLAPALPGGVMGDGSSSGVPADAAVRWESIFTLVRQHFTGQILWAVEYPGGLQSAPEFLHILDGIYLLWYAPLNGTTPDELSASAGELLDSDIKPFQASAGVELILAAAYASIDGAASAAQPLATAMIPGNGQGKLNLQAQADVYQALLRAVNERDWISGFISRGFYPPVGLQDTSASVHSKPAADVLWYWYPRMLGITH